MSMGQKARMTQPKPDPQVSHFISYLAVWGVEPVVTCQTSWFESTGAVHIPLFQHFASTLARHQYLVSL